MLEVVDVEVGFTAPAAHDARERSKSVQPLGVQALDGVSCFIAPGEMVAIIGRNGSGKSTLARVMCGAQAPDTGMVRVTGYNGATTSRTDEIRRLVGLVGQSPYDQAVSTEVLDEVAFGPRNLGLDEEEVSVRCDEALAAVGLSDFAGRLVSTLSGGELQRLALAGILAMHPAYLVLDEVTAQLDSACRPAFRRLFRDLASRGAGVVLVTHDPIEVIACDRVLVLEAGRLIWEGAPADLLLDVDGYGLWSRTLIDNPYVEALRRALECGYDASRGIEPEDVGRWVRESLRAGALNEQAVSELRSCCAEPSAAVDFSRLKTGRASEQGVSVEGATVALGGTQVLDGIDFEARPREIVLLAGRSGAGKTTLACLMAGLISPDDGAVYICGERPRPGMVGLAFQNPEQQFFLESVEAELAFAPRNLGLGEDEVRERVVQARDRTALDVPLAADPFSLSGGQARRVGFASVITADPRALVLDEPTAGLDTLSRTALHELVNSLAEEGLPVVVVSHDLEEWLPEVDRVVVIAGGKMVWAGSPFEHEDAARAFRDAGMEPPESWRLIEEMDVSAMGEGATAAATPFEAGGGAPAPLASPLLSRIDARVKIVLLLGATIAIFAAQAPWALALWILAAAVSLGMGGVGPSALLRSIRPVAALLLFIVCANLVSCDGTGDIALWGALGVSTAGGLRAAVAVIRIALLVSFALAVSSSTTPTALAEGCVRLMRPLGRFNVPVADVGLMLSMALRFIPLVTEEVHRIRMAQAARGVAFDEAGVIKRVHAWASVLTPVVVGLFRRADRVAESMDARLYESSARLGPRPLPLDGRSRAALAVGIAVMALVVIMSCMG
ncbi:ATP-binding cassette domain-containing protein [Enorma phocaeensis]|uniref:ATP-binding cassette domain-containing protein n=1 Tax=Enorma phocaeensis TaxID=1871019 RepID=A0A921IUK1_9ACTN|nr:ATP-binding cassette domain-containing protein [Enorma phocaeensis]HJG37851.1 ATP-binding cassette domain-containing protein [Enorma phocaeensis]